MGTRDLLGEKTPLTGYRLLYGEELASEDTQRGHVDCLRRQRCFHKETDRGV